MLPSSQDPFDSTSSIVSATQNDEIFGVELHNHLFGAVSPSVIYAAAKRKKQLPPNVRSLQDFLPFVTAPAQCADLLGFISIIWYYLPIIAGDRIALEALAFDFCRKQYLDKIYYSEARFTPFEVLGEQGSAFCLSYDEVMQTILKGFEKGCQTYGIKVRSLMSVLCEWNGDEDVRCKKTLEVMQKYKYDAQSNPCGVVGIDIAGNEAARVQNNVIFDQTFRAAKKLGFHRTVHAGEAAGAQSVLYAIENMCAERIGHGYRTVEDETIFNLVKEKNKYEESRDGNSGFRDLSMIHFECCPTSSVCTNAVAHYQRFDAKWSSHPMVRFVAENIHFSISTDDPEVFQTTMAEEIAVCRHKMDMSYAQIGQCHIMAAEAAFIDNPVEKQHVIDTVTQRVKAWVASQEEKQASKLQLVQDRRISFKNGIFAISSVVLTLLLFQNVGKRNIQTKQQ